MTAFMKILKIEGVVFHLSKCGGCMPGRADLELDHEDNVLLDQYGICPLSHSWNVNSRKILPSGRLAREALRIEIC